MSTDVEIRVALDSVIYAPLYAFVMQNNEERSPQAEFRFLPVPVHDPILTKPWKNLKGLTLISHDPVFSPVVDSSKFDSDPNVWFGVGDPVRVRRLTLDGGSGRFGYDFIGTLVSKLALWIIAESKCTFQPIDRWRFNIIECHSRGMTGHYLAEYLFCTDKNNPLAPANEAGKEIDYLRSLVEADWFRRTSRDDRDDPVWAAAITTEIDDIMNLHRERHLHFDDGWLPDVYKSAKIPSDFLMTAMVARRFGDSRQVKLEAAKQVLIQGLKAQIHLMSSSIQSERDEFIGNLQQFYRLYSDFTLAGNKDDRKFMRELVGRLKDIYPYNLLATKKAKSETDKFLKLAIESELVSDGRPAERSVIKSVYDELKTDKWATSSLWID